MFYLFIGLVFVLTFVYLYSQRIFRKKRLEGFTTLLDHDITVSNANLIVDEVKTGFDVTIGPTGWPVGVDQKWEIALWEDNEYYYARLIYHEYILWLSFDDPYIVCKIPKCNIEGDLRNNEKLRYQVLWDITYTTYRWYEYKPYMTDAKVEEINGHTVKINNNEFDYYKYLVISDNKHSW
jgi:hypothetical protein